MQAEAASVDTRDEAERPPPPVSPHMLHHVAYITYDSEATADFYSRVMRMPMVNAVMDDHLPSTGDRTPYFHTFFRMGDGSTIAFFESPGLPPTPEVPTPAFKNFNHIALQVPTRADVDDWCSWLAQNGVSVAVVDHHIIYSAYFEDPNGIRLEITATIVERWNDQPAFATSALREWSEARSNAEKAGADVDEARRAVIARHAHQSSIRDQTNGDRPR
jgi:catechol 2,3-dioxygenase-like lactoylglutathione lyase family enzyme